MKKQNVLAETTKREEENEIYRRFKLVSPDKERALLALMKAKGLERNDIILILQTIVLNEQCSDTELLSRQGITVLDKSPYSSKEVPSFRYNEKGRARLKELVQGARS